MGSIQPPPLPGEKPRETIQYKIPALSLKKIVQIIQHECTPAFCEGYGNGTNTIVILPEAWDELSQMIYFGKRRAVNSYEQHYQGMGHFFMDPSNQSITVVVSHFLYIYSANRGPTFAKVISGAEDTMLDRLANERDIYNKLELQCNEDENGYKVDPFLPYGSSEVVLFGHTHPAISCFFSETDRHSNYATPTCPICSFVCDPIGKDMKAMIGMDELPAKVAVFQRSERIEKEVPNKEKAYRKNLPEKQEMIVELITQIGNALRGLGAEVSCKTTRNWRGVLKINFRMRCKPSKQRQKR